MLYCTRNQEKKGIDKMKDYLFEIIDEETKPFFAGDKSADETAKTIQNRATTYLNESK